ncbi:MAG: 4Fe-4S double cluster binding domain-containing protein [Syntrophomonadaceae bacterium]|nr:4Fe-4S double cluster binding domain-containing protein [Syntrophomonadaceae bacterium]
MITKQAIREKALALGLADIGFTGPEPFTAHEKELARRFDDYAWTLDKKIALRDAVDPATVYPAVKSLIVVLSAYHSQAFPPSMLGKFGRCYINDDRVVRDGLSRQIKDLRDFLWANGVDSKVGVDVPNRAAAARAGVGTFGKNCMLYANRVMRGSSWVLPTVLLTDAAFEPDPPTEEVGCPDWCRNACIAACPTGALKGPRHIRPAQCISYLSYYGDDITPLEYRERMGMWVFGCDRCQTVCVRNDAWMAQELTPYEQAAAQAQYFDLEFLLFMSEQEYQEKVWPRMFYISRRDMWHWKMNVARVMGNSRDESYVPLLIRAYHENDDARVLGMIAWALGRLGGDMARAALTRWRDSAPAQVKPEIEHALAQF